jgi:hypothetical protein
VRGVPGVGAQLAFVAERVTNRSCRHRDRATDTTVHRCRRKAGDLRDLRGEDIDSASEGPKFVGVELGGSIDRLQIEHQLSRVDQRVSR